MAEESLTNISAAVSNLKIQSVDTHPLLKNNELDECETAEEAVTTDSDEYLSEPLRFRDFQYSTTSNESSITLTAQNLSFLEENHNFLAQAGSMDLNNMQIPIVGYEVMEARPRFTETTHKKQQITLIIQSFITLDSSCFVSVPFKYTRIMVFTLRIENKTTGDCWYVFRRYTDFMRLCNRLKHTYPHVIQYLPHKRWLGNFDPEFLEERMNALQLLVNAILGEANLISTQLIQDFFCLNEPPVYSETNEESRAMFEALADTIYQLKQQLREKDSLIDSLQDSLNSKTNENENLKKIIINSSSNCQHCGKDYENMCKSFEVPAENSTL